MDKEENQINEAENPVINNAMENDIFCEESIPNRKSEEILTRETINNFNRLKNIICILFNKWKKKQKDILKKLIIS